MKVLVTGVTGQLGYDVMRELKRREADAVGATRREMPLTDAAACTAFIERVRPEAVVHCAAYTAVDQAEDEPELCRRVNTEATGVIAAACRRVGAKLLYISTDYVFPGEGETPYEVDAATGPKNVYGASKLAGEQALRAALAEHFIVRVSWVFGVHGGNFIRTMLNLAKTHDHLTVVADQIGSPTYTVDLARLLADMVEAFRQRGLSVKVEPILSAEYPTKAARPHNSRLSKASLDQAGFHRLPSWADAARRYLAELLAIGE